MKLVHLVGFVIKKFVTMHGHMDVKFVLRKFTVSPQSNGVRKDEVMPYASYSVDCDLQNNDRKIKHMADKRDTLNGYTTSHNEDPKPSGRQTSSRYSDSCHRRPMIRGLIRLDATASVSMK